jgi:hypothetical protein
MANMRITEGKTAIITGGRGIGKGIVEIRPTCKR